MLTDGEEETNTTNPEPLATDTQLEPDAQRTNPTSAVTDLLEQSLFFFMTPIRDNLYQRSSFQHQYLQTSLTLLVGRSVDDRL